MCSVPLFKEAVILIFCFVILVMMIIVIKFRVARNLASQLIDIFCLVILHQGTYIVSAKQESYDQAFLTSLSVVFKNNINCIDARI